MRAKAILYVFLNNFSLLFLLSLAIIYGIAFCLGAIEYYMVGSYNPRMGILYSEYPVSLSLFAGTVGGIGSIHDEQRKQRDDKKNSR